MDVGGGVEKVAEIDPVAYITWQNPLYLVCCLHGCIFWEFSRWVGLTLFLFNINMVGKLILLIFLLYPLKSLKSLVLPWSSHPWHRMGLELPLVRLPLYHLLRFLVGDYSRYIKDLLYLKIQKFKFFSNFKNSM